MSTTAFGTPPRSPFSFGAGMDGTQTTPSLLPQGPGATAKAAPATPQPAAPGGFDMSTFLQFLMGQMGQNQQPPPVDLGQQLAGVKQAQDPQGIANKGYMPGINNQFNPFSNGFFNTGMR